MAKWEYMTLNIRIGVDEPIDEIDKRLNMLGDDEWELVNMDWEYHQFVDKKHVVVHAVFKRPKSE